MNLKFWIHFIPVVLAFAINCHIQVTGFMSDEFSTGNIPSAAMMSHHDLPLPCPTDHHDYVDGKSLTQAGQSPGFLPVKYYIHGISITSWQSPHSVWQPPEATV